MALSFALLGDILVFGASVMSDAPSWAIGSVLGAILFIDRWSSVAVVEMSLLLDVDMLDSSFLMGSKLICINTMVEY